MSAKEKAFQLFCKFYRDNDLLVEDLSRIQAKECALIAVDEIIKSPSKVDWINEKDINFKTFFDYWQEVRQEIEKL